MTNATLELPQKGQNIEFKLLFGPYQGAYGTYVEEVERDGVTVAHPMAGGNLLPLTPGDRVRIEYSSRGARIAYTTAVRAVRAGNIVVLAMPERDSVERYQQRDFVRLNTTLQLTFTVLYTPPEDEKVRSKGPYQSYTRDISGSGAQLMCTEDFLSGTQLDVNVDVKGARIHTVAEVVRVTETLSPREHWVATRFVGLTERERDVIIRYIFQEQLARRRRGLL